MKNIIVISTLLLSLIFLTNCTKDSIKEKDLPAEIRTYISLHFPDQTIKDIDKDYDDDDLYEIKLSNGVKLDFDHENKIIEIDGNTKLPDSVIPTKILDYVITNYPTNYITDWKLEISSQEVKLNNDLELVFTLNGDFIKIDG